jgi:hypothetical protein
VFAENWVVYHYWNVHAHRNEVSVLEVFDDDAARRTPPLLQAVALTALGLNRKSPISSLAPPAVRVMGQSYFFSMGVKTMAVTSTQRGITSKSVLLGTSTDQVRGCVWVTTWLAGDGWTSPLCACLPCLWLPYPLEHGGWARDGRRAPRGAKCAARAHPEAKGWEVA